MIAIAPADLPEAICETCCGSGEVADPGGTHGVHCPDCVGGKPEIDLLIVDHPIPLTIAVAIMHVVGAIYPGAVARSNTGHVLHLTVDADAVPRDIDFDEVEWNAEYPLDGIDEVTEI